MKRKRVLTVTDNYSKATITIALESVGLGKGEVDTIADDLLERAMQWSCNVRGTSFRLLTMKVK